MNSTTAAALCANATDDGRFSVDGVLTRAEYARVSNQAHSVLALGVLCSTLSFGFHILIQDEDGAELQEQCEDPLQA